MRGDAPTSPDDSDSGTDVPPRDLIHAESARPHQRVHCADSAIQRQRVGVRAGGDDQPVLDQAGQAALAAGRRSARRRRAAPVHRARRCRASTASSRPRHCRSVPAQVCAVRGGPSYAGWPARAPGAQVGDRAVVAARVGAPCRPGRRAPSPRPTRSRRSASSSGSSLGRHVALGPGDRRRPGTPRRCTARASTRRTLVSSTTWRRPKAKRRDRGGGVVADARAAPAGRRTTPAPRRRGCSTIAVGRGVQPQRAARVAEPAPRPDRLAGGLGGQVGRGRPALEPGLVDREHPRDRGLLEHELRDHHRPRARRPARARAARGRGRRTTRSTASCRASAQVASIAAIVGQPVWHPAERAPRCLA